MNLCQKHWDRLRERIDAFGLTKFVANSGKEAVDHFVREAKGEDTVIDFAPLLGTSCQLYTVAIGFMGFNLMQVKEGEEKSPCPVCALENYDWVEGAAYQGVREAVRRGLITEEEANLAAAKCEWKI